jgi:hypothetical protein
LEGLRCELQQVLNVSRLENLHSFLKLLMTQPSTREKVRSWRWMEDLTSEDWVSITNTEEDNRQHLK